MRVQTEEWRKFIPGVRMYKGKMTYFYNGEILWAGSRYYQSLAYNLIYTEEERHTWEVIIVLPGVEIIPEMTFSGCKNVEKVIMADTVTRIGIAAFSRCENLTFVKISRKLKYIEYRAFEECESLTSVFIPDSCRRIGHLVFLRCQKLIICQNACNAMPLRRYAIVARVPFGDVNAWVKSINDADEYGLHRLCSSMDPSEDTIYDMICEQGGPHAMARKNSIGITPSEYLAANPYADVDEMKLLKRFVLENMGEIV